MMKHYFVLLLIFFTTELFSQELRVDDRQQNLREDDLNEYNSEDITNLDLLKALEFFGIRIHKYSIGDFAKPYMMYFFVDEYIDGVNINTDTIMTMENTYHYYLDSSDTFYIDFIDNVKVISKEQNNKLELKFDTYSQYFFYNIDYETTSKGQFYNIRDYKRTKWVFNEKIPLMVFASSWWDERHKIHRFCGAVNLDKDDYETKLLLERSPRYYKVSYLIKETND